MASLLERMSLPPASATGPIRSRSSLPGNRSSNGPYNRPNRTPKGDVDSPWSHDLFEAETPSLSARLNIAPTAPRVNANFSIAQKALREAMSPNSDSTMLSIKGASNGTSQGNVIEVTGLVHGTTADDVAAIFKRCGDIVNSKSVPTAKGIDGVTIRVTFRTPAAAAAAVQKFNNQPADGKLLSVRVVGNSAAGTSLAGRLGDSDGLGLVREEGSVDVLMDMGVDRGSKMRSDSLIGSDPRAQVLIAPPGANIADYTQTPTGPRGGNNGRRGGGRSRGGKRGGRRGGDARMDTD